MNVTWRFSALDSWFFKEARPFDSVGGSALNSVFPPSPAVLAGAIRSVIGEYNNVDWGKYSEEKKLYPQLPQIGGHDSLGDMTIKGVFLSRNLTGFKNLSGLNVEHPWQRLYPVPAHLVATQEEGKPKALHFLQVGKPVQCDLGKKVCLPVAPKDEKGKAIKGVKPLDNYWLTQTGFEKILNNIKPDMTELIPASDLFSSEFRLGIARNNQTRNAEKGMLYQTQHLRPKQELAIEVDVAGLASDIYPKTKTGIVRLGGEGRGAAFKCISVQTFEVLKTSKVYDKGIKLILLSALHVPQTENYTPLPNFEKHEHDGETVWIGEINDIKLTLHCAIIGKAVREGGWDLQKRQPKPVRSLLPAGSVFYCTVDDGDIKTKTALTTLHNQQIAEEKSLDKSLGRGLFAVCPWFEHYNFKEHA